MPTLDIRPFGYTSKPLAPPGFCNGRSQNVGTYGDLFWPDRGYNVRRLAAVASSKACASFLHLHTDGTEWPFYVVDTEIRPETGSDSPSAIGGAITQTFNPSFVNMAIPAGMSVLLTGTNSEARFLRVISSALTAGTFDLAAPGTVTPASSTTGGNFSNGTYYLAVTEVDATGATTVESAPTVYTVVLTGGTATQTINVPEPSSPAARTTHYRYYISSTTNTPTAFLREVGVMESTKGSGTFGITSTLAAMTEPIANRNGSYRQATMPLTGARWAWLHEGRLFIASDTSNKVYFSERDAPNHWYDTNSVDNGASSAWNSPVTGGISANGGCYVFTATSIHRILGSLTRDDQGDAPTYALDAKPVLGVAGIGCVSHATIVQWLGIVYFMSQQGPCALEGNTAILLKPGDIQGDLDDLDWTYAQRFTGDVEVETGYYCIGVVRLVNSTRAMDGAAVAGFCDRVIRWDTRHTTYAPPLSFGDFTHLKTRKDGGNNVTTARLWLMAMGPHGHSLRLRYGWSGGGPLDVSGVTYDGYLATANTTTSATITLAGISDNALAGRSVYLYYPTTDTGYPGEPVLRTIVSNSTSGSALTINWTGALTVPSGTKWTVRIAGLIRRVETRLDMRAHVGNIPPKTRVQVQKVTVQYHDVVGTEGVG